jgi:hypothetical protein
VHFDTGLSWVDVEDDFSRARRRQVLARLAGWLRGRPDAVADVLTRIPPTGVSRRGPGAESAGQRPSSSNPSPRNLSAAIKRLCGVLKVALSAIQADSATWARGGLVRLSSA